MVSSRAHVAQNPFLIIVAAVTTFVMGPRKDIGLAAAFCWLYDVLRGLRRGQ